MVQHHAQETVTPIVEFLKQVPVADRRIAHTRIARVLAFTLFLLPVVGAQDTFLREKEAVGSRQPANLKLLIAAPKAKFFLGETIPLTLAFTASQPRTFVADSRVQDRVGRMNYTEEFRVDPVAKSEDPLRGLAGESGGMGGISGGNVILTADKPFTVERNLNEWVRFRAPGTYRLYVLSRRVREVTEAGKTDLELQSFGASKPAEVASNILTLEIVAAPPKWASEQIAAATAVLDGPVGNENESWRARQRAGLALRFLNTLDSGIALARRLPDINSVDAFALHSGILDSHHRAELLPQMEQLLAEPGQAISERFLATLAQLAVLVEAGGVMAPYPADEAARQVWQAESKRRAALATEKRDQFVSILVRNLPKKAPEVRALTRDGLLSVAEASGGRPPWLADIVKSLIADFRSLPGRIQASLLDSRWRLLRGADVLPLLLALHANPPQPQSGYPSINELVLRRIYELRPERGRALILEELHRQDGPRISGNTLMMLPDENLPELNGVFAAQAARGGPLPAQLMTRYATGQIVKEIEAGYLAFQAELDRQKLPHCPFPLVFYFLKFDPEFGERELRKAFATSRCYDMGRAFDSLGSYAMSPALERLAIEHLASGIVPIKRGAAEVLGRYGSPAAQQPLWDTMEYFRSWWKDREDDFRKPAGQEGVFLERALRVALGQAGGWVLDEAKLRRLLALCSTGECRANVEEWIRYSATPKTIEISAFSSEARIRVAQYTVTGDAGLKAKLAQFPQGTIFRISETGSEEAKLLRPRVEAAIRIAGHRTAP